MLMKKLIIGFVVLSLSYLVANWMLKDYSTEELYYSSFEDSIQLKQDFTQNSSSAKVSDRFNLSDELLSPIKARLSGDFLLLLSIRSKYFIYVIDIKSGKIIDKAGGYGKGPQEFESASDLIIHPDKNNTFIVYDSSLMKFSKYGLTENGNIKFIESNNINTSESIMGLTWLNENEIASVGSFQEGRITLLSQNGEKLKTFGELPPGRSYIPPQVRQQAYQSWIASNKNRDKLVVATRHSDKIEMYDSLGNSNLLIKGFLDFEPVYDIKYMDETPSMTSGDDLRFGYIDLAVTDERIFALYSGKERVEGGANYGNFVLEFDWTGHIQSSYKLEQSAISIAVNDNGTYLYGVHSLSEEPIVKYILE